MQWLARALRDKDPRQLNFPFALWTLAMVKELIFRKFGVGLSEVSVGRILKTLGFSPQRPIYRATQRDKVLVNERKNTEYPKIKARAKKEGAVIFFGDESGVRSDYHRGTTWGERGKTPVVKSTGARFSLNMISAISPRGHFRFMTVKGSVTAEAFCDFLKRLVKGMDQKIFLILDNHRVHHSKKVRELAASLEGKLEIFYLPPYSPDLNPDEQVWNHGKRKVSRSLVVSKEHLENRVMGALRSLQKMPALIRSFFKHPSYCYTMA